MDEDRIIEIMRLALDETIDHLMDVLIDFIQDSVYDDSYPEWYDRTYQFKSRSTWKQELSNVMGDTIEGAIYFDESGLIWNPEKFQHGNIYEKLKGESLVDIINDGTDSAGFGFRPREATRFWDEFVEYAENNMGKVFMLNCRKHGLPLFEG